MNPEDEIPDADNLAEATRRAFRRLGDGAPTDLSWPAVQTRARRVQRTRVAVAIAAALVVVVGIGATVGAVNRNRDHVSIAGRGGTTTSTAATTTSTTASTTTTTTTTPAVAPPINTVAPVTNTTLPPASGSDVTGAFTLASAPLFADQSVAYTITLRNQTDHIARPPNGPTAQIGVWAMGDDVACSPADPSDFSLNPRAEHTYSAAFTPAPEMIGFVTIYAAYIYGAPDASGFCHAGAIAGVDPVTVFVLPPGYVAGQPLDPSIGKWSATVTADATQVTVGDAVTLHATLQNDGTQDQLTRAYGSLAIGCEGPTAEGPYWHWGQFVDAATVLPGDTTDFSVSFAPEAGFAGTASCGIGLAFHDPSVTMWKVGITSDIVHIAVLPAETTTTTSPASPPSTSP